MPATRANYRVLATTDCNARPKHLQGASVQHSRYREKKLEARHSADTYVREICADDLR